MAFKSYISYNEYIDLGGTVSSDVFPVLERKAQRYLDFVTFNRIQYLTSIPDVVKEVLVEFIDNFDKYNKESTDGDTISRYSNGVETIDYRRSTETEVKKRLLILAEQWLPDYLICKSVNFNVEEYLQSENNNT